MHRIDALTGIPAKSFAEGWKIQQSAKPVFICFLLFKFLASGTEPGGAVPRRNSSGPAALPMTGPR
jgi:hypothetical protein